MTRRLAGCALASVLAVCARAHAEVAEIDHGASRDAAPAVENHQWYGWQTLSIDAAALGMIVVQGAAEDGSVVLGLVGLGTYALGAPVIQFAHDNEWAAPSLGLRLGSLALMLGGAFVALSGNCLTIFGERPAGCDTREAIGGTMMIVGVVTIPVAIVLDAVKARSDRPRDRPIAKLGGWADPNSRSLGLSLVFTR